MAKVTRPAVRAGMEALSALDREWHPRGHFGGTGGIPGCLPRLSSSNTMADYRTATHAVLDAAAPHMLPSLSLSQIDWIRGMVENSLVFAAPAHVRAHEGLLATLAALRAELNKEDDGAA